MDCVSWRIVCMIVGSKADDDTASHSKWWLAGAISHSFWVCPWRAFCTGCQKALNANPKDDCYVWHFSSNLAFILNSCSLFFRMVVHVFRRGNDILIYHCSTSKDIHGPTMERCLLRTVNSSPTMDAPSTTMRRHTGWTWIKRSSAVWLPMMPSKLECWSSCTRNTLIQSLNLYFFV